MNKFQWNSNRNSCIFIQENAFETVICEMAAILSLPQCINSFNIFAASTIILIVSIFQKFYKMQRILFHIKANPFVKYHHLHPEYAANLVTSSEYYNCHWILLTMFYRGMSPLAWCPVADPWWEWCVPAWGIMMEISIALGIHYIE